MHIILTSSFVQQWHLMTVTCTRLKKFVDYWNSVNGILVKCYEKRYTKFESGKCKPNSPRILNCMHLDAWIHTHYSSFF